MSEFKKAAAENNSTPDPEKIIQAILDEFRGQDYSRVEAFLVAVQEVAAQSRNVGDYLIKAMVFASDNDALKQRILDTIKELADKIPDPIERMEAYSKIIRSPKPPLSRTDDNQNEVDQAVRNAVELDRFCRRETFAIAVMLKPEVIDDLPPNPGVLASLEESLPYDQAMSRLKKVADLCYTSAEGLLDDDIVPSEEKQNIARILLDYAKYVSNKDVHYTAEGWTQRHDAYMAAACFLVPGSEDEIEAVDGLVELVEKKQDYSLWRLYEYVAPKFPVGSLMAERMEAVMKKNDRDFVRPNYAGTRVKARDPKL